MKLMKELNDLFWQDDDPDDIDTIMQMLDARLSESRKDGNNNTMSKNQYVSQHIFWSIIAMIWYRSLLFRCVEGMTYSLSKTILWGILLAADIIGILITWKHRRNCLSLFVNISKPFEIYLLITYAHTLSTFVWVATIISILIAGLYTYMLIMQQIKDQTRKKAIMRERIVQAALGSRTIVTCCFSLLILCCGANAMFGGYIFSRSETAANKNTQEEATIDNNIEVIAKLEEAVWRDLPTKERLLVLQTLADVEGCYLGLKHDVNVAIGAPSESKLACYDDRIHTIIINIDHLEYDSAIEICDTLLHEMYHALQHRLCDAYDSMGDEYKNLLVFNDIQHYKQEFSNYISGEDDALAYYLQECEIDARAHARDAVKFYYSKITAYLKQKEP